MDGELDHVFQAGRDAVDEATLALNFRILVQLLMTPDAMSTIAELVAAQRQWQALVEDKG